MSQADPAQAAAEEQSSLWYLYLVAMVAAVGGFLFGYDLQIISGALIFLEIRVSTQSERGGIHGGQCGGRLPAGAAAD